MAPARQDTSKNTHKHHHYHAYDELNHVPSHKTSIFPAAIAGVVVALCLFFGGLLAFFNQTDVIASNVVIDGKKVGGMSAAVAALTLDPLLSGNITVTGPDNFKISTSAASLQTKKDIAFAIQQAKEIGRSPSLIKNVLQLSRSLIQETTISSKPSWNDELLKKWISSISSSIHIEGIEPKIELKTSGNPTTLAVISGTYRRLVDEQELLNRFHAQTSTPIQEIVVPIEEKQPLTPDQSLAAQARGAMYVGKKLEVSLDGKLQTFNDQALIAFLDLPTGLQKQKIEALLDKWHEEVERPPREPEMKVEHGKVVSFTKPLDGRMLDRSATQVLFEKAFSDIEQNSLAKEPIQVLIVREPPKTALKDLNNLGINEMIGGADSTYFHSIPGRVFNVNLTSKRIHLSLVAPGETYSFNKTLGEVSGRTGFQAAYVIRNGRTELGDGGGVCQVSTTLFRAALNAGLPIVERHGHSYRVGYYEQNSPVGVDATVYGPRIDFRFKNDTPAHILVVTEPDPTNFALRIELWGTADGRVANVGEHKIWAQTPPRATVYQDDPSLPPGKLKQVDWSAPGAKASFHYSVTRGTEVLQDETFTTNYKPWAAVYLRGV